jgi:hypothetical protein
VIKKRITNSVIIFSFFAWSRSLEWVFYDYSEYSGLCFRLVSHWSHWLLQRMKERKNKRWCCVYDAPFVTWLPKGLEDQGGSKSCLMNTYEDECRVQIFLSERNYIPPRKQENKSASSLRLPGSNSQSLKNHKVVITVNLGLSFTLIPFQ